MFCIKRTLPICVWVAVQAMAIVHGDELVRYDLSGASGSQASTPSVSVHPHLIADDITGGGSYISDLE